MSQRQPRSPQRLPPHFSPMTAARHRAGRKAAVDAVWALVIETQLIAARKDVLVRKDATHVAVRRVGRRCVEHGTTTTMTRTAPIAGADHRAAGPVWVLAAQVGCLDLAARRNLAECPAGLAGALLAPVGCPEWAVRQAPARALAVEREVWTTASLA